MRIAAFELDSQTCRAHTLRGSHPRQSIKHPARHGHEQVFAKAVPQDLSDVLNHVTWEVWRVLVCLTTLPLAVIGPHGLLSVTVHRRLCQLMQSNSRREVGVSEMACGKYGSRRRSLVCRLASIQET